MIESNPKPFLGVREPLPLRNFPAGRIRIRLRNYCYAMAYVKTETGIRCFAIGERDGHWEPVMECEQGRNIRTTIPAVDVQKDGWVCSNSLTIDPEKDQTAMELLKEFGLMKDGRDKALACAEPLTRSSGEFYTGPLALPWEPKNGKETEA